MLAGGALRYKISGRSMDKMVSDGKALTLSRRRAIVRLRAIRLQGFLQRAGRHEGPPSA